ncbi:MAG: aspartate 1-decarboxylase [Candidatus Omnitrophica bacterium]|nr:aspartate 1-decarboxylase [Candidatus Omnitrophota bacterium]
MLRIMCKSKIHKARITKTDLHYQGSIGVDKKILEASNIYPNEIVQVLNLNNGSRFETYAIEERADSGEVVLYGPAARLGEAGDTVIVISKALVEAKEVQNLKTKIVYVNDKNKIVKK